MITVDGTAQAAINANARGFAILVDLEFSTGTQRFTTWPVNVLAGGNTYIGLGNLVAVQGLSESEDRAARRVKVVATVVNNTILASVIGPASVYRGRFARVYQQLMADNFVSAGAPIHRWTGRMERVSVERDAPSSVTGSSGGGRIVLDCSRAGAAQARRADTRRSTHAQQSARYPGDRGLEYQQDLVEKPSLWLSKRFQEV